MRKGSKMSDEQKKKLSEAGKGRKHTAESIKKMSESHMGEKNPMYGLKHSEEIKRKISKNHRGIKGKNNPMYGKTGKKCPAYKHGMTGTKEYQQYHCAKRRAAKKNQTPILTENEKRKIGLYYQISQYLGDWAHVDHIQPLSKGGLHHPDNLQILDAKLNMQKNDKWPLTEEEEIKYKGLRIGENMSTIKQLQNSAGGV